MLKTSGNKKKWLITSWGLVLLGVLGLGSILLWDQAVDISNFFTLYLWTEAAPSEVKSLCFWWLAIIIILIISLMLYHRYIKEEKPMFWWIWPIAIAAVLFFVQEYFDKTYQPTIFCHWFWLLELIVLVFYFAIDYRNENRG